MGNPFSKPEPENTNLEIYSLIWLDAEVRTSKDNIISQERLRTSINQLKIYDNIDECEEYIRSLSENDRIIFLSSGSLGIQIVPKIHDLRQIYSIYIYCYNKAKYDEWSKKFIKVQGVFVSLDGLIQRIISDKKLEKYNKVDEQLSISIFNPDDFQNEHKTELNDHFIYSQILIDCLLQLRISQNEKTELLTLCKTEYKSNKDELKIINEFEFKYISNDAIKWYTRDCFLFKMLSTALLNQNLDLLFLFHNIIFDIQNQINENKSLSTIHVYRSQLMLKKEFKLLKNSFQQFISINSFLTAISDRKSALLLLSNTKLSDDIERVLFEIQINENLNNTKSFTNIKLKSYYNQEEIFFSIGSIFQLIDICKGEDDIKIIKMELCTNDHPQLKSVFNYIEQKYGNTKVSPLSFGLLLRHMNKYEQAKKYYQRLIKILPTNHANIIECNDAIQKIYLEQENYKLILKKIDESVGKSLEKSKSNYYYSIYENNNKAKKYQEEGDLSNALIYYEKVLSISIIFYSNNHPEIGRCYYKMGLIHQQNEEYSQALECFQQAKNIFEQHNSLNNPDLTELNRNIDNMRQYVT